MNTADICRETLDILADADGFALPEDVLKRHLKARMQREAPAAAFDDAMAELKRLDYIACMEAEFSGDQPRWHLTKRGEVHVRK